jgi:hypothetical protein
VEPPIALAEHQYKFGVGPIVMCAARALAQVEFDGEPWWHLTAEVANGTPQRHGGWVERELYVPVAVLDRLRRR